MADRYVLGSDIGSGACKSLLVTERGRVVASSRREYPTSYPRSGWVEQDPEDWYQAFCLSVRELIGRAEVRPREVVAMAIVGVTHNTVLLDRAGRPVHPCITFFDSRSAHQVRAISARWGSHIRETTLNDMGTLWSWPQLCWLRDNRPELWRRVAHVLFAKDYVRNRVAPAMVTDPIDAAGSLLFDPRAETWVRSYLEDLELGEHQLPRLVPPTQVIGGLCDAAAQETGLRAGTPVIAGTTDTAAELLGSGALRAGDSVVKLASVGRIAVVHPHPVTEDHILNYRHVLSPLWYPGTASKYAASAYRWLRGALSSDGHACSYAGMDEEAARAPAGSAGLLFHPHLMGEWAPYWDERMRGSFVGLSITHGRSHIIRSVMEGAAFGIRDAIEQMAARGLDPAGVRLIGRGATSALWAQTVADVLGRSVVLPTQTDAAFGAALLAAVGVGDIECRAEALDPLIDVGRTLDPDPRATALFDELFLLYRESDRNLRSVTARLAELAGRSEAAEEGTPT